MTENVIINVYVSDQSSNRVTHCDVTIHGALGAETKEANYLGIAVGFTLEKGKTYTATVIPPTGYTSVSGSNVSFVASQSGAIYCSLNKTTTAPDHTTFYLNIDTDTEHRALAVGHKATLRVYIDDLSVVGKDCIITSDWNNKKICTQKFVAIGADRAYASCYWTPTSSDIGTGRIFPSYESVGGRGVSIEVYEPTSYDAPPVDDTIPDVPPVMPTYKNIPPEIVAVMPSGTTKILLFKLTPIVFFGRDISDISSAKSGISGIARSIASFLTLGGYTGWNCLGSDVVELANNDVMLLVFLKEL